MPILFLLILEVIASVVLIVFGFINLYQENVVIGGWLVGLGSIAFCLFFVFLPGFHIINPKEAVVLTFFGNYYGTITKQGFYYTNPFATAFNPSAKTANPSISASSENGKQDITYSRPASKKVSTKTMTLENKKQKVNDILGNPIIIGAVVIWKVKNPTIAVFNVEDYKTFLSTQCDSTIRNIARLYPYDSMEDDIDEKTLRGSSQEIAASMKIELQSRVEDAGLEILEVRITHLSYAEEIAAAMLQRQQAVAIIAARQKIVEGAVSMVKMAIDQLGEEEVVVLDEERKAAMVSNLLVVLCGNKDAQPIVNSGSIY
ncbi:MAG: SPFH domain-containing protein [Lachnospiraceae bacterium]